MSRPEQDVRHELLDFEVQSPVKLKAETPEHTNCDEVAATKVLGGHGRIKTELDADHLEEGEVKVEGQGNLEDGEISEEEKGGQPGFYKKVCRHFAAGRICLWGQVPPQRLSWSFQFLRIAGSHISRKRANGGTIQCSLLKVQSKLLWL